MKGFPIETEVTASSLATILAHDHGTPINRLRRLEIWAKARAGTGETPPSAGRYEIPGEYGLLYDALDGVTPAEAPEEPSVEEPVEEPEAPPPV